MMPTDTEAQVYLALLIVALLAVVLLVNELAHADRATTSARQAAVYAGELVDVWRTRALAHGYRPDTEPFAVRPAVHARLVSDDQDLTAVFDAVHGAV